MMKEVKKMESDPKKNLWPDDLFDDLPHVWEKHKEAPLSLLKKVGEELVEKSAGLIDYEIIRKIAHHESQQAGLYDQVSLEFHLLVSSLDNYDFRLFTVEYRMDGRGYPAKLLDIGGEEFGRHRSPASSRVLLKEDLKEFLALQTTQRIVSCIYFHIKDFRTDLG
jgi:hypothetical protein